MLRIIFVIILFLCFHSSPGQWSCSNPAGGMVVFGQPPLCYATAPGDTVDICFSFTSPGSILMFTSLPGGSCSTVQATAVLYDDSCNVVYSNAFGQFLFVTPGANYVWCLHYVCTGTHAPIYCPYYQDYSALPVTLTRFEGSFCMQCDAVNLTWLTDGEFNNEAFYVEHTSSWNEPFKTVGKVAGQGTTTKSHVYKFIHKGYVPEYNFYRLKQVDYNGTVSYSNVIMVKAPQEPERKWVVYDIAGRRIVTMSYDELKNLMDGFYILRSEDAVKKYMK